MILVKVELICIAFGMSKILISHKDKGKISCVGTNTSQHPKIYILLLPCKELKPKCQYCGKVFDINNYKYNK